MIKNMFFIIGAQKAGTTALWQYLRQHPEIGMPHSKEAPYFASAEMMTKGWDWYESEYFSNVGGARVYGTASPQYMCHSYAADNIYKRFPDAKIIAILRDPVHRAVSHYKMAIRWGHEERILLAAIREELDPRLLEISRNYKHDNMGPSDHKNCYIAWGEYKRILSEYVARFSEDRILFLTQDELLVERHSTYSKVLDFLDVQQGFVPPNLEVNYHVGQLKKRNGIIDKLLANSFIRKVGRMALTAQQKEALLFWINTRGGHAEKICVPREVYEVMVQHYMEDVKWLSEVMGRDIGWLQQKDGDIYL